MLNPVKLLADGAPHDHWLQLRSPAGHEVRVYNRTSEKAAHLAERGATLAATVV